MKLQTRIQVITNAWLLALVASIVLLFVWNSGWRFVLFAFTALFFFALGLIILITTQRYAVKKIGPVLFNECDPEKFLGAVYASMPPGGLKHPQYTWTMLLYEGDYAAGRYEDALASLAALRGAKWGLTNPYQKAGYLLNLAEVSTVLGKSQEAGQALDQCKQIIEHEKLLSRLKEALQKVYLRQLYKQRIAQGRYDGAEQVFEEAFAQAAHVYDRAGAKHHLAIVYQLTGEADKEREALEYVAAHGNRLYFASCARQRLGLPDPPGVARLWQKENATC